MNRARGEAALELGEETHVLCLTLGALAEIETALGCETLSDLQARLKRLSASDLLIILFALLKGGGWSGTIHDLTALRVDLPAAARAVAEAFSGALR